ncbi:uncharacterized protein DUF3239 [Chitinophaga niastensis]|uniref:Uncharacterized protein DUF3239 n=1 Tax=Chitinophaga niastensis TaxID=536980 RepID=A0A2P8HJF6_CHINA|nr:DUF3239 domain-containing protein [Chitinophaga niastensis]PSL46358.1 uncharacterized protein DUF3239 [Chitinophaga niastensis]
MENIHEKGKPFNNSQAIIGARIDSQKELINRYDECASKSKLQSKISMATGLVLLGISINLFRTSHWIWGAIVLMVTLIVLYFFLLSRGLAAGAAYESGLLVPAILVSKHPLEIVVLANVAASESINEQYACKKITLQNLPLHIIALGEKVPCVAMFGGIRSDIYSNFEPRPLAWATDDYDAIQDEISRIREEDWLFLQAVKEKVPAMMKGNEIALFDSNHEFMRVV